MLNILFIGDINGKIGRLAVDKILPKLRKELEIDLVIANAENSAHGSGTTSRTIEDLQKAGVDWMTNGDHAFKRSGELGIYEKYPIVRPANFPPGLPGQGFALINHKKYKILLINLIGRVFMPMNYDCPLRKLDEILANTDLAKEKLSAIIIDIHGECTSEKIALRHYADGRASAIFGTHTHVMTADEQITDKGTAFITDAGMVGYADGCIGIDKKGIIQTLLTQVKYQHIIPEEGRAIFNACLVSVDPKTAQAKKIKPIKKIINI